MKKAIFTLTLVVLTTFVFGQITKPDSTKKEFKNIIELDVTELLHQFLYTGTGASYYYGTPYMISYKRILKNNNAIRFGVSGSVYNQNSTKSDTLKDSSKRNTFNVGLGIEHYCYLTKRWNFFFGIDLIANYTNNDLVQGISSTITYHNIQTIYGYGASPLLGIQFKINSRMSISTEMRYDIVYNQEHDKRSQPPSSVYDYDIKDKGMQTTFNPPININFRIHF